MIRKKNKNSLSKEFTDADGKKWVQTSPDDLFSIKELNDIIKSIDKQKDNNDIILAHIDFKKVNKEYYDAITELQSQIKKKDYIIRTLVDRTKVMNERKNKKLNELIAYIRKLHMVLGHLQSGNSADKFEIAESLNQAKAEQPRYEDSIEEVYENVEEYFLDEMGNEMN